MATSSSPAAPAPGAAAPKPGFHIPALDGIRAISFLIVFLSHAGLKGKVPGYFGLSVFFFLSGYLITTLLRMEFDRAQGISLKEFYIRRALRIFPTFYLVLFLCYALTALGAWHGSLGGKAIVAQLLHLTNYYIIDYGWWEGLAPGTWVYWSLAVEEHFYLVFPLLYLWMRRRDLSRNQQAILLLGVCALMLAWRVVLALMLDAPKDRMYVASDTRVDSIIAGCILAIWKNPVLDKEGPSDRSLAMLWLPLGAASVLISLVIRKPDFEQTLRYTLQSFGLLPFFVAAIRWHDRGPLRLLGWGPVKYLGVLSYAMYLTHTTIIWGLEQRSGLHEPLRAIVALALVIGTAALLHRFVEKPVGRLRHRFGAVKA